MLDRLRRMQPFGWAVPEHVRGELETETPRSPPRAKASCENQPSLGAHASSKTPSRIASVSGSKATSPSSNILPSLAIQTSFVKKVTWSQYCNHLCLLKTPNR